MDVLNEPMSLNEIMNALTSGYFPGFRDCESYAILNKSMNNVFADQDDTFFGIADDVGLHNIVFVNKEGCLESTYRDNIDKNVLDSSRIFALSIPKSEINNKLCAYMKKEISKEDLYSTVFEETLYSWDQLQFSKKVICEIDESVIPSMIESSIYQSYMIPNSNGNWINLKTMKEYTQSEIYPGFFVEANQDKTIMEQILVGGAYYTEEYIEEGANKDLLSEYTSAIKEYSDSIRIANSYLKQGLYNKCIKEYDTAKKALKTSIRKIEAIDSTKFEALIGFLIITLINSFKMMISSAIEDLIKAGAPEDKTKTIKSLVRSVCNGETKAPGALKNLLDLLSVSSFGNIIDVFDIKITVIIGVIKISIRCIIDLGKIAQARREGEVNPNVFKIHILDSMKKLEHTISDMQDSARKIKKHEEEKAKEQNKNE